MASYKEHCSDCMKELGKQWAVVHLWLDEYFVKMGCTERHRDIRHHKKGIEEARKKWGDQAAMAAEIHIKKDFYGYIPEDENDVQKWRMGIIHKPVESIESIESIESANPVEIIQPKNDVKDK